MTTTQKDVSIREVLEPFARAALNVHFPEKDPDGHPSLTRFFLEHGRLPYITDEVKPWDYPGWLLAYVILIQQSHPDVADRWGYHLRTLNAGRFLDESIPTIHFQSEFAYATGAGRKQLENAETIIERSFAGSWSSFQCLVDWLSWALGVCKEKPRFEEKINEELYRTFNLEPFMLQPSDYLGSYLAERRGKGWNPNAFYPTPHTVVEMMCRMTFGDPDTYAPERDRRTLSVMDPCVGSGRMLLHASNFSMNLYGQDKDALVVKICKINGALYAPWMSFPLPREFFKESYTPPPPPAPLPSDDGEAKKNRRPETENRNKNQSRFFALTIEVRACSSIWRNN